MQDQACRRPEWILTKRAESYIGENHFYVFVLLRDVSQRPDFYVVPSKVVADHTFRTHREWLEGTKADGTSRRDSAIRNFRDIDGKYKEAWSLLNLELING